MGWGGVRGRAVVALAAEASGQLTTPPSAASPGAERQVQQPPAISKPDRRSSRCLPHRRRSPLQVGAVAQLQLQDLAVQLRAALAQGHPDRLATVPAGKGMGKGWGLLLGSPAW